MKKKFIKYIQLDHRKLNPNHTIKLGLSSINQTFHFVQVITPGYFLLISITSWKFLKTLSLFFYVLCRQESKDEEIGTFDKLKLTLDNNNFALIRKR